MSAVETVQPTLEAEYGTVGIRYWEANKELKVKRHYEVRDRSIHGPHADWHEVVSVTAAQDILKKEALIHWGQRIGAGGIVKLCNLKVLQPVQVGGGQPVLGFYDAARGGMVVCDEWEAVELLAKNGMAHWQVRDEAADRGTSVHDAFENFMLTGEIPDPTVYPITEQPFVIALVSFLRESGCEPRASEVMVAHVDDHWAGRYDGDIWLPEEKSLYSWRTDKGQGDAQTFFQKGLYRIDVKTGKGPFPEYGEQLEAYEAGALYCGQEPSLQRCVIQCKSDGRYAFVPVGSGHPRIPQYAWASYEDFLFTLYKYRSIQARKERRDG